MIPTYFSLQDFQQSGLLATQQYFFQLYLQQLCYQHSIHGRGVNHLGQQIISSQQPIESKSNVESIKNSSTIDKPLHKKTKRKTTRKSYNNGHWTRKEHRLYLEFIDENKQVMSQSDLKKSAKIFKQMSQIIKTRSPSQCRSHHQKFNPF